MLRYLSNILAILLPANLAAAAAPGVYSPPALKDVAIEQKLDVQVPADLVFTDEYDRAVKLKDYYGKRPLILALVYYQCPMLCTMVLNDLTRSMNAIKMSCGEDFDILTVSFDPRDTPALALAKKQTYLRAYQRPAAAQGWHFLTGQQASIDCITDAVGFRYSWDAQFKQYAHASGIIILSPQGKTTRYFYGIDYAPADLQLSLAEAAGGKSESVSDRILLYCFHYDASTGRYTVMINRIVQTCGVGTAVILGLYIGAMLRREKLRRGVAGPGSSRGAG